MENNYLKTRFASVFDRDKKMWTQILILGFLMLFAHLSTYAQPCTPDLAMTITTYDASEETVSDARIRVSGITNNNYKVGISPGPAYTGPAFAALGVYSTLTNGFVAENLAAPIAAPGTEYTVRVFNVTGTCYTDSTFYLPYVNYNYAPTYVDLQTTLSRSAGDLPLGGSDTVRVVIRNVGTQDATGVVLNVAAAAGLELTGSVAPAGTSFVAGTGVWTVGAVPINGTITLVLVYKVNTRGIKEVKAEVTALNEIDLDSSPTPNVNIVEDDEGQVCISTHFDFCNGDEFRFALANNKYKDVVWQKYNGSAWVDITGSTAEYTIGTDSVLVIKSAGDYRYIKPQVPGSCAYEACCPVKVIPGLPPDLTKPTDRVICFGQPSPLIASTNVQNGYTATSHTTYGIPVRIDNLGTIPGFLADQGVFNYQWYNNNGPSNPGVTAIPGNDSLVLETLPTAAGIYNYRLISVQDGHTSCTDTTEVEFIINEIPIVAATSNSPICQEDTIELAATNDAINPTINPFPAASFEWWGPNGFTSNTATDTVMNAQSFKAGNYFVRAFYTANGLECADTTSIPIVVNPLPDMPNAIDTTYCQEIAAKRLSVLAITSPVSHNGTILRWYEGPANYNFTDMPDTTTAIGYNVGPFANTSRAAGQYKWFVTQVDALGCQSHPDTLVVTIDAKPLPPTVADIAFCENSPTTPLTATTAPGSFELIWYGLNKTNIPGDTTVTYPAPPSDVVGVFTYWVSQSNTLSGCQSDTIDFDVHIKDTPLAPAVVEPTYCLNETAVPLIATPVITNTVTGATNSLTWYWNGSTQPTAPTPITTLAGATWAYVTQTVVYDTLSCESPQAPLKITVNPLPVASLIPVSALCVGTTSQNNGMLILTRYRDSDQAAWNIGSTVAATPTFAAIPATGIIASSLPNPTASSQDYSVRVINSFGCTIDLVMPLVAKDCSCPGGYCEPAVVTKTK